MVEPMTRVTTRLRVNGVDHEIEVAPTLALIDLLRDRLGLMDVKLACSRAVCGSCTVLIGGQPTASCALFAFQADGAEIVTAAGLVRNGELHPVQQAFAAASAFQCGYCTPGMVLLAKSLLDRDPYPNREAVIAWMSSNICRCTGYNLIVDAVLDAARRMREASDG